MNLGDIVGLVIVLFVVGVGIAALTVLLDAVFPRLVRRARNTAERMPFRSAVVGAINFFFFSALALIAFAIAQDLTGSGAEFGAGVLRLFGVLILSVLGGFIAFGIAAIARWVGERMMPEAPSVRQSMSGIITLELAALAPLVGWFLVPLVVMCVGYGAVIIALVWRRDV